jgi:hypothetical protein
MSTRIMKISLTLVSMGLANLAFNIEKTDSLIGPLNLKILKKKCMNRYDLTTI